MEFLKNDLEGIIKSIDFSYLKNKKILITGASGLVGFYLSQCLKELQNDLNIEIYLSYKIFNLLIKLF
jgi:NADPH:quinone reductase-like Zn-dependent oxidoreductase